MAGRAGGKTTTRKAPPVSVLPAPLIPSECDLTDLPAILLERSIGKSDLAGMSNGDEFKAAILLYVACYDQSPAGSLPDDDRVLAFLSHAGSRWAKVRSMALRGWILCSDGRLYHPLTAEKVLYAWIARLRQRLASGQGNSARWGHDFDRAAIEAQISTAIAAFEAINPGSPELARIKRNPPRKGPGGNAGGNPGGMQQGLPMRSQAEAKAEGRRVEKSPSQIETPVVPIRGARA